jgi:glycosyltransferase involved in cell wall biosynthesis
MLQDKSVSVAIPVYNEANSIEKIVRSFLKTNYPNLLEILIADGGSNDGTQNIISRISQEDSRVKLLDNPGKIQSAALNIMLQECKGDIFLRADGHSDYAPDYIEKCVEALLKSKADNVGGAQRFVAKTTFQSGVALASRSFLGSGGAKYRNPNYDGYADTVYLGCFWQQHLLEIGGYCIEATPNEDADLNQRLINHNKKAIYVDSSIKTWYYPRNSWHSLFVQYFRYGMARCRTNAKYLLKSQLRGLLPFIVISNTILLLIIDVLYSPLSLPTEVLFFIGLFLPFLESLRVTLKFRQNFDLEIWRGDQENYPSLFSRWFWCGITLLTMPVAHFAGYSYQILLATGELLSNKQRG